MIVRSYIDTYIAQGMDPEAAKRKAIEQWLELRPELPNVRAVRDRMGREIGAPPVKAGPKKPPR